MTTYCVIDANGLCVNTIVWDGETEYDPGDGLRLLPMPDDMPVSIGWHWVNSVWQPLQPYPSWTWNGTEWIAPSPMPDENGPWSWDEETLSWLIAKN